MVKLEFDEKKHIYKLGKKKLRGVTTWVSSFFPEFNEEEVSKKVADKRGVPQKEILKEWKDIRTAGTSVHKEIEDYINKKVIPASAKGNQGGMAYLSIKNLLDMYPETEKQIFSKELGLAGTVDLVLTKEDDYTKTRAVLIDWKTNKEIARQNPFQRTEKDGAVAHLHYCNFNKYSLQLSTYAYILEKEYGMIIDNLFIVHLKEDSYEVIPVDYLKEVVKAMVWSDKNE